jgi:hypothetical protein
MKSVKLYLKACTRVSYPKDRAVLTFAGMYGILLYYLGIFLY